MKMLLTVAAVLAGVVVVLFGIGALLPADWRVERSITVQAPPTAIYPLMANFKTGWVHWNPWAEPSMRITYSGPDEGAGAVQTWTGGDTNGGTIRLTRADPRQGVDFALTFGPFPIDGRIAMSPAGDARTQVTWTDTGRIAGLPIYRFMRFGLERFVGQPMERGLAKLKERAEAGVATAAVTR